MDDNREMPNEENRATPDRPSMIEEKTGIAEEEAAQAYDKEQEAASEMNEAAPKAVDAAESQGSESQPAEAEQPGEASEIVAVPASDVQTSDSEQSPTVESVIEAILFATDEPLPESKLAGIVETTGKQVRESVENLNARYEANGNAFRIE